MRIRDALLSARSYLTILIGFLLGFAIVEIGRAHV